MARLIPWLIVLAIVLLLLIAPGDEPPGLDLGPLASTPPSLRTAACAPNPPL